MLNNKAGLLLSTALLASYVGAFSIHHRDNLPAHKHLPIRPVSAAEVQQNITARSLERRFDGARFTFYDAGLGACGKTNSNSDFIVAINAEQYAGGSHCFETITITVGSKTHSAQIVDECEGCPFAGLDFSRGLFDFFASESAGVLTGSWNFGGAAAPPPPPKTTVRHDAPAPTSTHVAHTTTHVTSSKHSSSTSATASSSTPSGTVTRSGSAASSSATGTDTGSSSETDNLQLLNLAYIQIASLIVAGGANGGGTS